MSVRLEKLLVSNFRSIGSTPVEIELDDIVILVGGNNFGKSTILRAYHSAVNSEPLGLDDFHNRVLDKDALPTVEIHTRCSGTDKPSDHFYTPEENETEETSYLIKERFIWKQKDKAPFRYGYLVKEGRFAEDTDKPRMPWSNDGASKKNRPKAHLVGTFSNPEEQSEAIQSILVDVFLEEQVRKFKPTKQDADYSTLYEQMSSLKKEFVEQSTETLGTLAKEISQYASKIIPGHELKINISEKEIISSNLKIFDSSEVDVRFGKGEQVFPISHHGSGARRTLLWSVLKQIAEMGYESSGKGKKAKKYNQLGDYKSHLLLLDEPELSLHPSACRDTRDMLYNLAENNENWQVMITTHSPSFIDLTRDHTKIIRVENNSNDEVEATTIFRPDQINFTEDETESLKLFNLLNPDVMEFFFGGKVFLVEGDTEYTAFGKIIKDYKEKGDTTFDDLFILRCGGKVQVSMFMKILNHFKKSYFVLHDIDTKQILKYRLMKVEGTDKKERKPNIENNPAWTNNSKILEQMSEYSQVFGSVIDFETAYFNEPVSAGKPENAVAKMKEEEIYNTVESLLLAIVTQDKTKLPSGAVEWEAIEQISDKFDSFANSFPDVIPKLPN
ncbi:AAA family ATPase [Vibrio cholerae]|uniref:ATP-dependent nuclease n=1 Tax=Vibrio cholerae TaxID=666 RepID=UPI0011F0FE9D|nr:AAA family ATPase [Vibrio cholerae]KAA0999392.1 AAA family ATPase [Vibrio cholerae]KAA1005938.1 AAA family ATPase [Vibrio cholerae]KAA1013976.1 AAA family ATPase [Vibrio cholerae]KAA1019918.1 AAA family ATPase [Vibrio cholerae]KAA1024475.1 AAA family ATPase [Vibrio cholerae]